MSLDTFDFYHSKKSFCSECDEQLHPESEEYSIAQVEDRNVTCEDCQEDSDELEKQYAKDHATDEQIEELNNERIERKRDEIKDRELLTGN